MQWLQLTSLMSAAEHGETNAVTELISLGADVNLQSLVSPIILEIFVFIINNMIVWRLSTDDSSKTWSYQCGQGVGESRNQFGHSEYGIVCCTLFYCSLISLNA